MVKSAIKIRWTPSHWVATLRQSGEYNPETRSCLIDVAREHPEAVLLNLGMKVPDRDSASAVETHPYVVELYNCLNDVE